MSLEARPLNQESSHFAYSGDFAKTLFRRFEQDRRSIDKAGVRGARFIWRLTSRQYIMPPECQSRFFRKRAKVRLIDDCKIDDKGLADVLAWAQIDRSEKKTRRNGVRVLLLWSVDEAFNTSL